jgi:alpha-glucosidase
MVRPGPEDLPVYVRAGSIVPMAPLVQSTEEKPNGPLTLRVFPGDDCHGSVYQDDGVSYDFRKGMYLRQSFSCSVDEDGAVTVSIGAREGAFRPWWTSIFVEVVGLRGAGVQAVRDGKRVTTTATTLGTAVTLSAEPSTQAITFRATSR